MNEIEQVSDSRVNLVTEFTIKELVDGKADGTDADLYVFRNDADIFYIGISTVAVDRAFSHLVPMPGWASCTEFRRFAIDNKPNSLSWTVQFYGLNRCCPAHILCTLAEDDRSISRSSQCWRCLAAIEALLIGKVNPPFNNFWRTGQSEIGKQYKDSRKTMIGFALEI
jgi:hypothetical protein